MRNIQNSENDEILKNFEDLFITEINALSIRSIKEIKVDENYKVSYNLNGYWIPFDKLPEGAQPRVKIAFYLSLIQLDIQFNIGRHPRLLFIDSPNKEEGDEYYVDGLKKLLEVLAGGYANDLQLIIATAARQLENILPEKNIRIYNKTEFLF